PRSRPPPARWARPAPRAPAEDSTSPVLDRAAVRLALGVTDRPPCGQVFERGVHVNDELSALRRFALAVRRIVDCTAVNEAAFLVDDIHVRRVGRAVGAPDLAALVQQHRMLEPERPE